MKKPSAILENIGVKLSLKRLLAIMLVLSVLPGVIVTGASLISYRTGLTKRDEGIRTARLSSIEQELGNALRDYHDILLRCVKKGFIQDYLTGSSVYKAENAVTARETLGDLIRFVPGIDYCIAVTPQDQIIRCFGGISLTQQMWTLFHDQVALARAAGSPAVMYKNVLLSPSGSEEPYLMILVSGDRGTLTGALVNARTLIENSGIDEFPFSIRQGDDLLASNHPAMEPSSTEEQLTIDGTVYRLDTLTIEPCGWTVTLASPVSGLADALSALRLPILLVVVFSVSQIILVFAVYMCIVSPIRKITRQTDEAVREDEIINPSDSRGELGELVQSINAMKQRVSDLTEQVSERHLKRLQHDLDRCMESFRNLGDYQHLMRVQDDLDKARAMNLFLQSQVSPHMLYNTLECISCMASIEKAPEIRSLTIALSRLYRYCIQHTYATLEDEIESVQLFLEIMKYRRERTLELKNDIDECFQSVSMPRMILEPLVENAVKHGFRGDEEGRVNCVRLDARFEGDSLVLTVEDNGCGIPAPQLARLQAELRQDDMTPEATAHIGLRNVNSRIRYLYGEDCGVFIDSPAQQGTVVTVRLRLESDQSMPGPGKPAE